MWTYSNAALSGRDLTGYKIEAIDGDIGKIDEATNDVGGSYVVVDTGPWIFGKKVIIPAGLLAMSMSTRKSVFVNRTKEQIKNAPEFNEVAPRRGLPNRTRRLLRPGGCRVPRRPAVRK